MWVWLTELLDRRDENAERARQHELELRVCRSCEVLQNELARYRERERELFNKVVNVTSTPIPEPGPYKTNVEVATRKGWSAKRAELELRDRKVIVPSVTIDKLDEELEEARNAK
jgi:hypothetical protein